MNSVFIIGNLTRDPEANGPAIKFSIANNEKWRGKDGNEQEKVNYIDCVAFGKTGEIVSSLNKGTRIAVEGRLSYSAWEKDGQKRSKIEVNASRVYAFGKREPGTVTPTEHREQPKQEAFDSDIPF